jgi:hypothetical protein
MGSARSVAPPLHFDIKRRKVAFLLARERLARERLLETDHEDALRVHPTVLAPVDAEKNAIGLGCEVEFAAHFIVPVAFKQDLAFQGRLGLDRLLEARIEQNLDEKKDEADAGEGQQRD